MVKIDFSDVKKQTESEPLPERIDTGRAVITNPELIAKYVELSEKEKNRQKKADALSDVK